MTMVIIMIVEVKWIRFVCMEDKVCIEKKMSYNTTLAVMTTDAYFDKENV